MKENGNRKREWIKTAAIIFLAVMLVLTFFSNTIMNYSLPEVATQYVTSGSITARIRGTGVIESGELYNVEINESRKVSGIAVKVGDKVQKGDVLVYLEETESEELKAAQDMLEEKNMALQDAWDSYYIAILNGDISAEDIKAANGNVSANTYRKQLTEAQEAIKPWKDKVAELTKAIADIDAQMALESGMDSSADARVTATTAALETARVNLDNANAALASAENALKDAQRQQQSVSNSDADAQSAAAAKVQQAQAYYDSAKTARDNAQTAYTTAVNEFNSAAANHAGREGSQIYANLTAQRAQKEIELYSAQENLDAAQKNLDDLTLMLGDKEGLDSLKKVISNAQREVDKAQKQVDELTQKATASDITADISGTVTAVNVVAGKTTVPNTPVVVLQPEGQGYTLSFPVTIDQARKVNVGDRADLVNAWRYYDVEATLASIKPDPNDPGQNKLLTFNVTGEVVAGQSLSLILGQQSANYDLIVPNSAIREDNNGKFILKVDSRPTPLSTRYIATRVDVEVLASDDTQSAISGALYGYEYVITTSTKPVEAGQQVRLTEN